MKTLALVLIALITSSSNQCLKLDIILLGDMSTSVEGHQRIMSQAFKAFVEKYEFNDDNLQMGIVTFNTKSEVICSLTSDKTKLIRESITLSSKATDGNTYLEEGLNEALNQFVNNGIKGHDRLIIIVSDGDVDHDAICLAMIKSIKSVGIKVCSVLIKDGWQKPEFMKTISSGCYVESSYESLHEEIKKLNVCL